MSRTPSPERRLGISAETGPHVSEEARELARRAGPPELAYCNMRFEVTWPTDASAEVTNALFLIADALCGVVTGPSFIFDPALATFI